MSLPELGLKLGLELGVGLGLGLGLGLECGVSVRLTSCRTPSGSPPSEGIGTSMAEPRV